MDKKRFGCLGLLMCGACIVLPVLAGEPSLVLGPYVKYVTPQSAVLAWQSNKPATATVEIRKDDAIVATISIGSATDRPQVTIPNLESKAKYVYQIALQCGDAKLLSPTYEIDNSLNYTKYLLPDSPSPFENEPDDGRYEGIAQSILSQTGIDKGYCLVYGCVDGRLAYELAKNSELTVIGVDSDPARIQKIRQRFMKKKLYGVRFTFYSVPSLDSLPIPDCFANLIVSERMMEEKKPVGLGEELMRVLRPDGGIACLGFPLDGGEAPFKEAMDDWARDVKIPCEWQEASGARWAAYRRPSLPDTGSWTHQYGTPANTANSGDSLFGATATDQLDVQWIGRPGADFGVDRNPRMPSPLSVNGRLFHQGLNRIAAIDAYNGSILWSMEIPALRRVNMPRDASNWCADKDAIYVAIQDRCWRLDGLNGDLKQSYAMPPTIDRKNYEWGYIANQDSLIYGSAVKKGSVYTEFFGEDSWYDQTSGYGTGKICSDLLFASDKKNGNVVWDYQNGTVINTTITIGEGKLFFVESRHPALKDLQTSRIESPELWLDQFLVALDAKTGQKLWEKSIDTHDGIVVFYLAYTDSSLLITSSGNGGYHLYSYNAQDGNRNWEADHPWPNNNHGGHMQHPAITGQAVYLEPCGYDLKTGNRITDKLGRHEGCATYAAASGALIYRGKDRRISLWDIKTGVTTGWVNLRPSCWLSVIPAGGMVLAPEGGGGCSCGNWLETSIVFSPFFKLIR